MTPEPVQAACTVDWGPLITGLQTVLIGCGGLLSAYTIRLLRNGSNPAKGGRRASDHDEPAVKPAGRTKGVRDG